MKHHILRATPLAALFLVAACDTQPTTIVAGGGPNDPTADQIKAAPPVKLPPAMLASKSYRCKDNSLVYIDWFNDNETANLHLKDKSAMPINLKAPSSGAAYVGGDYTLTGTAEAKSITLKKGSASQDCDA
jgi:membrane-bound inhibitor of C-type lysozyme